MPAAGAYDHTNDLIVHQHRPDVQIPDLGLYREKRLGERAGKDGPYYFDAAYDSYDPAVAHNQGIHLKITPQNRNQRKTDWDLSQPRDEQMYKTIEFGAHIALENTKEQRQAEFDKARREKRELAMVKHGILPRRSIDRNEKRGKSQVL